MVQRTILIIYCRLCSYCRDVVKTENSWKNIHVMCASFWALFPRCKLWSTPLEIFIHLPILKPSRSKLMRHKRQWPWGLIRANDKMRIRVLLHTMIFSTIKMPMPMPHNHRKCHVFPVYPRPLFHPDLAILPSPVGTWAGWPTAARQRSCPWWATSWGWETGTARTFCSMPRVATVSTWTSTVSSIKYVRGPTCVPNFWPAFLLVKTTRQSRGHLM